MTRAELFLSNYGVACAAGLCAKDFWIALVEGNQSTIRRVTALSGEEFFAARIGDECLLPSTAAFDMRLCRIQELALNQLSPVIQKAIDHFGPDRVGVCVGSCDNGSEFSYRAHEHFFKTEQFPQGYTLEVQGADYPATFISAKFALAGPSLAFSTACSSSAAAIIKAAHLVRASIADAVVTGGVDIASDTVLLGFNSLGAVSPEITNPFSKNRRGITLGEGAAFFVLSREDLGGTGIQLLGFGESSDAHHMTSPDPTGEGAAQAMQQALQCAGLTAGDIDYLNLHGTGTKANDAMESQAVARVFGSSLPPASSTKPITGHTLGAASALELAVCFSAIAENRTTDSPRLPAHIWDGVMDDTLPQLNLVKKGDVTNRHIRTCMTNSFAFGGSNASLILGIT